MNCPSRTDAIALKHPTWNQSPPALAPDLTTCQDLNGMANARERRDGGTGGGGGTGNGNDPDEKDFLVHPRFMPDRLRRQSSGRWDAVSHPRSSSRAVVGGEGQPPPAPVIPSQATRSSAWGWISWTASVLACSVFLSALRNPDFSFFSPFSSSSGSATPAALAGEHCTTQAPLDFTLAHQSPAKRDVCGGGGVNSEEYGLGLHVGALFIMVAVSFGSCAFPLIAKKLPFLRVPASFFFGVRHFGTGVLIATAFVHLLPTAFVLLGDECLSSFWIDDYDAMPGAIALAAVFFVAIIEMIFQPARQLIPANSAGPQAATVDMVETAHRRQRSVPVPASTSSGSNDGDDAGVYHDGARDDRMAAGATESHPGRPPMETGPLHGAHNSLGRTLSRLSHNSEIIHSTAATDDPAGDGKDGKTRHADIESTTPGTTADSNVATAAALPIQLTPAQQQQKDILQCMMLEVGILFHSVFIGMTLAVTPTGSSSFVVLLVAIIFHQAFEGLALGARIADISWPPRAAQPWLMALAYGCTTPLGQAIGIATHTLYDPDSEFGLVLVGTMNAISSGLLVFASLVELLSEDFLSDESWRTLRGARRVWACLLVFAGAFGMSVVGAWA